MLQKKRATCAAMTPSIEERDCRDEVTHGTVVVARNFFGNGNLAVIGMKGLRPKNCKQNNYIDEDIVLFTSISRTSPWIRSVME